MAQLNVETVDLADDERLTRDLFIQGLMVTEIVRSDLRLVVAVRTARGTPLVGVVDRGPAERDHVFARLMTKATMR